MHPYPLKVCEMYESCRRPDPLGEAAGSGLLPGAQAENVGSIELTTAAPRCSEPSRRGRD
ncbi:hypothetical protein CHELA20_11152 [Hyphomicrobiales bacterium]|nr:hypothetical protein CHELA20_11152 [Hyphomicrobiales bacterium]CAH1695044.1 hypothetical protein CHELA41_51381 [Hyphomicrobiales bacterium]